MKNLTETRSEAQAVLGPAAVHISAVNMSCSYTFSWSINIAKSSQDKVTCMYFHVLAVLSSGKNKPAALPLYLPCIPGESYCSQKSSVQTVTCSGREKQGSLSHSGTVHLPGHSCLKPRTAGVVRGTRWLAAWLSSSDNVPYQLLFLEQSLEACSREWWVNREIPGNSKMVCLVLPETIVR